MKKIFLAAIEGAQNVKVPSLGSQDFYNVIDNLVDWLFGILLVGAVFVIILAAYKFLTSAGDVDKVKEARNLIIYALVAIVVAFLSEAIVYLVVEILHQS